MIDKLKFLFVAGMLCTLSAGFTGCVVVKKLAGADIDPERFAKAREAKMMELRFDASKALQHRLGTAGPLDNADMTFYLSQEMVNKAAKQFEGTTGWLDTTTSYTVRTVNVVLYNGSGIASLVLQAHSDSYNVDVDLVMDCSLTFVIEKNELMTKIEPFNISPAVTARGLLSGMEDIIKNIIAIKVGNLSQDFPPMKFPIDFSNNMRIDGSRINIANKLNLIIQNPARLITYKMTMKEFLIFEGKAFIAMNVSKVEVR